VHYPNPLDYKNLAQMLEDWKMTILPATPTVLKGILKAGRPEQLQFVLKVVSGGERTPQEVFEGYEKTCPQARLREGYGVTECSPVIAVGDYTAPRTVGVGKPFRHVEAAIVSLDTGEKLSAMQEGIICVTGPSIFSGYLDKELKSPFLEFDGKTWYNTGDLGYLTEEGVIVISGRLKRFVKIGGEMISLPALEQILEAKWPSNAMGPSLALQYFEGDGKPFIVMLTTQDIDKTEVNNALKEGGFSNLARISQVLKVEKIPLQGTGKTDFRALKEMAESLLNQ
ncbi:AMP-binding protein, partial [bacterium]|nr:AMP-binding protein [bacterium]